MKILLTGANGYIGQRLLPILVERGHKVLALVRSSQRLLIPRYCRDNVHVIEGDLSEYEKIKEIPNDIDIAYYLVHSMTQTDECFGRLEDKIANNFLKLIEPTNTRQIIYLSGLISDEDLSPHLKSRKRVEDILHSGPTPVTILRAGIIIGSGSASFEIMRDLIEKLPIMVTPKWAKNKCQPIAIYDVLEYLTSVIDHPDCLGETLDIGGPDTISYQEMLKKFSKIRGLRRFIITVPVLTPRLSSYWLYFITSTNFSLARALVESLKNNALCQNHRIKKIIPKTCFHFEEALKRTLGKIEENSIISSWKDSIGISNLKPNLLEYLKIPKFGCLSDLREIPFQCNPDQIKDTIWAIGGDNGWYYMNWMWKVRGFIDKFFGGIGLKRGRTHPNRLRNGDVLDFWRVLLSDKKRGRLLLYAEMRLPGEAWLEFEIIKNENKKGGLIKQKATFRPNGLLGRLYWYSVYPLHWLIFSGMARGIIQNTKKNIKKNSKS
jgi:uncharacterized protein YbjT (DUF2867 family)